MTLVSWLLSAQTAFGAVLVVSLWVLSKLVDKLLEYFLGRKIISPTKRAIVWRVRSVWTRVAPITGTFQITYGVRSSLKFREVKSRLESSLKSVESLTGKRIQCSNPTWRDQKAYFEAEHVESSHKFDVEVRLVRSNDDLMENPDAPLSEHIIQEVNVLVDFEFAFPDIDSELPNVGVFMSKLERALDQEFHGNAGPAKIKLHPLESDLSLDDWIAQEELEPTLRLTGRESPTARTKVEFFSDHVELHPPYYEIDGEVIRYVRLLVKHYYLLNSNTDNILRPSKGSK